MTSREILRHTRPRDLQGRDRGHASVFLHDYAKRRFHSFSPRTYLDRMDLTVIRPMMFVDEMDVIGFKNKYDLPVVKSKCPVDGYTKRQYAKELVRQLNTEHPGAKERMFRAILNGDIKGWPERILQTR